MPDHELPPAVGTHATSGRTGTSTSSHPSASPSGGNTAVHTTVGATPGGDKQVDTARAALMKYYADAPHKPASGDLRNPKDFPTYEAFAKAFQALTTFKSKDTASDDPALYTNDDVLGDAPGVEADKAHPEIKPTAPQRQNSRSGEEYMQHPTVTWINQHLPEEMRHIIYECPADCADVAAMLRHVWLYAHDRTEQFGPWVLGVGAGRDLKSRMHNLTDLMGNKLSSENVEAIVGTAYQDENGGSLRNFAKLQHLLHPGDVLVWKHLQYNDHKKKWERSGGHTQTIQSIDRDENGNIRSIDCLQGNQPIFEEQAHDIQAQPGGKAGEAEEKRLRNLPGRRVERFHLEGSDDLGDKDGVWTWGGHTVLVAAGPPSAVRHSGASKKPGGAKGPRKISDWNPLLSKATLDTIPGIFEAALQEVRAHLEGASQNQGNILDSAHILGVVAGHRLSFLKAQNQTKYLDRAKELIGMTRAMGADIQEKGMQAQQVTAAHQVFDAILKALAERLELVEKAPSKDDEDF